MTLLPFLNTSQNEPLTCIDMHTMGMPVRTVVSGYPNLPGTLQEQRALAEKHHDHIRTRLLQEPRGHIDMFGAVLRPKTEYTDSGEAHMGVFYLNGEGYSNMCGHATFAVCRLLVDIQDAKIFPRRNDLEYNRERRSVKLVLHTLGGLVEAEVPTNKTGMRSDPSRPVKFIAVPAISLVVDIEVEIPRENRWPELGDSQSVKVSLAYVSAVSCHIVLSELGFPANTFHEVTDFQPLLFATQQLKAALNDSKYVRQYIRIPSRDEPASVFGVMIEDPHSGDRAGGADGSEMGMYIFGDRHQDRSPTGSVVSARNAIKYARKTLGLGHSWTYHSILTNSCGPNYGFVGKTVREISIPHNNRPEEVFKAVLVQLIGFTYYTGMSTFIIEEEDPVGKSGFLLHQINKKDQ